MHELIWRYHFMHPVAWVLGLLAHFFRQPLIGLPCRRVLNWAIRVGLVKSQESISVISELGLIFMLFMIGWRRSEEDRAGRPGYPVCGRRQLVGGCALESCFLGDRALDGRRQVRRAVSLHRCALSSTVIIVKVLYEKRELDTLPGGSR